MSQHTTCFLALEPDEAFAATVLAYKRRTRQLVGPQQFLEDPPHLTLYLAAFPGEVDVAAVSAAVAGRLQAPAVDIQSWHVFAADPLTGHQTLVCQIAPQHRQVLALCQERLVEALAPLRDRAATRERYAPSWLRLSRQEQDNVERHGFPFLGAIWQPHVTIASIRGPDWDTVWHQLASAPPAGLVRFPSLSLYALHEGRPLLLEQFSLETSP